MLVTITVDGETTEQDITLDMESLSMKQAVQLEKVMGSDRCQRLLSGDEALAMMPTTIQALMYVQLSAQFPGLKIGDFDFDLAALDIDEASAENVVVDLPMTLADGTTVQGASEHVDPTQAGTG